MSGSEARSRTPLFDVQTVCFEDGSPLPMAGHVRGFKKLQAILAVSHLYDYLLLVVFRGHGNLAMDGSFE